MLFRGTFEYMHASGNSILEILIFVLSFLGVQVQCTSTALVEELSRVKTENKKLTEMLTVLCENYTVLRTQLMDYMNKYPPAGEEEEQPVVSRKRKAESTAVAATTTNNIGNNYNRGSNGGNSESSSTDEDSCKKPREEHVKATISRAYVRTEASDTSLVSRELVLYCFRFLFRF